MSQSPDLSEFMSVRQFCEHARGGFSYSFVTKLAREGKLEAFKLGKLWRIHKDAERLYRERLARDGE